MTYTTETNHTQTVAGNRDFSVGFPFLATTDIKVQLNGVTKQLTTDYTIVQSGANTTINFNTAPATSPAATIRIFRDTDIDAIEATYAAGNAIRASDLNTNNTQLLYAAQEFGTLKTDNSVSFSLGNKGDLSVNSSTDWTLNDNSIELAHMTNNSVGTNELINDSVTQDKIADDAILTAFIQDNQITNALMADNSVNTAEIVNNAVTRDKVTPGGFNPVGTVIWYAGSSAPAGYLKCNGDAIANGSGTTQSITADFSALYAVVGANLPDLRGEFVRGWDDGKGTDSGRAIRSTQSDQNKQHNHSGSSASSSSTTATTSITGTFGNDPHNYTPTGVFSGSSQTFNEDQDQGNNGQVITLDASHNHTTTTTTSLSIANEGGNETRPRNVALLACIKY